RSTPPLPLLHTPSPLRLLFLLLPLRLHFLLRSSTVRLTPIFLSLLSNALQQSSSLASAKHNSRQQNSWELRDKLSVIGSTHLRREELSRMQKEVVDRERRMKKRMN